MSVSDIASMLCALALAGCGGDGGDSGEADGDGACGHVAMLCAGEPELEVEVDCAELDDTPQSVRTCVAEASSCDQALACLLGTLPGDAGDAGAAADADLPDATPSDASSDAGLDASASDAAQATDASGAVPLYGLPASERLSAAQWGTVSVDEGHRVAVDTAGNAWVVGHTDGDLDAASLGYGDVFVTKLDSAGTVLWTTQWGTGGNDQGAAIAVDAMGAYVTGFVERSLPNEESQGSLDVFVTRLDTDGTVLWSTQWGGSGRDAGLGIALASDGSIYVGGETWSALGAEPGAGLQDVFVSKLDADGTVAWTTQWGSAGGDSVKDVAVDDSGNCFAAGSAGSSIDGSAASGVNYAFVTKLSSEGELVWTRQWGSDTGRDEALGVRVDGSEIVVAGTLSGLSLDAEAFAARLSTDGDTLWTTQWAEPDHPTANALAVGSSGHAHIVGRGGSGYIVLIELDPAGEMVKATRWEVASGVEPRGIDLSPDGTLAIAGHTWGELTSAPNAGGEDAFLIWVDPR